MKTTRSPKFVFLLDYDGTLTDFHKNPDHSRISAATRSILRRLRRKYPVIFVSGRNVDSLSKVSGLKDFPTVGSHGFEAKNLPGNITLSTRALQKKFRREAELLWKAFQSLKKPFPEIHIEQKPFSSTIHYRGIPFSPAQEKELRRRFHQIVEKTVSPKLWSLQEGKKMLEIKPKGFSKGLAVLKIMKRFPHALPLYAGDDLNDIPAFQALGDKGLKVAVGNSIPKGLYNLRFDSPGDFVYWLKAFL
jgi:trehalose 6-phosphate phosphatase